MKIKYLVLVAILCAFSISVFSQNNPVEVTSNKVTYKRKGKNVPDHKKTFEVNYPKISGISDPIAKKNLEKTLNYWTNFETTLEENLGDYFWLSSFDYNVIYNKNSLLAIDLTMEGSGAYPDSSTKTFVISTKTGKRISISDAFTNIGQLLVQIEKAQKAEIEEHLKSLKEDSPEDYVEAKQLLNSKSHKLNKLDAFFINDEGVTFMYDYGFAHAIQALQPDGRYFFTWKEMKPYIKPNGVFGNFAK